MTFERIATVLVAFMLDDDEEPDEHGVEGGESLGSTRRHRVPPRRVSGSSAEGGDVLGFDEVYHRVRPGRLRDCCTRRTRCWLSKRATVVLVGFALDDGDGEVGQTGGKRSRCEAGPCSC